MQSIARFFDSVVRFPHLWRTSSRLRKSTWWSLALVFFVLALLVRPPDGFPANKILTVREKASVGEIAEYLQDHNAIGSPLLFKIAVTIFNPKNGVLSGQYYFSRPKDLVTVAYRISRGNFGLSPVAFTVPEGSSVFQIADLAKKTFPTFDAKGFVSAAAHREGYLFPDTYNFLPTVTPKEMIETMEKNFQEKIVSLEDKIRAFGRPIQDVVKMASYLEEEARLLGTRRIVAGILWKRIDEGMPLQIDASFQYVNGKNTYQLTLDDLKIDSPYNTYAYKGLTPTPISNPGLGALLAAVTPIKTKYYFFLTDALGNMHYAITHDEHVANKDRYLR